MFELEEFLDRFPLNLTSVVTETSCDFHEHYIESLEALPHRKIASYLPPVKDAIGLKTPGLYRIPCECGTVYIGQVVGPLTYA